MEREFDLGVVLCVTTDVIVTKLYYHEDLYDLVRFICGRRIRRTEIRECMDSARPQILLHYPALAHVDASDVERAPSTCLSWLEEQKRKFGDRVSIVPLANLSGDPFSTVTTFVVDN